MTPPTDLLWHHLLCVFALGTIWRLFPLDICRQRLPAHLGIARWHIFVLFIGLCVDQRGRAHQIGGARDARIKIYTGDNMICSKNMLRKELKEEPKEMQVALLAAKL